MEVLLLFLCVVLFIASATATPWPVGENKELSRERRAAACPTVQFSQARMPTVWANMDNAINNMGKPKTLNRVATTAINNQNRIDSGCPALTKATGNAQAQGLSCDEYPFASSTQGGTGAVIAMVVARDNCAQGGTLRAFYQNSNILPGGCYTVHLVP